MLEEFYEHKKASGGDPQKAAPYYENPAYCAQPKIDGVRYMLHKDMRGMVRIYSRGTSVKTGLPVDKTNQLLHIAQEAFEHLPYGTILDGEVCSPAGRRTTFKDVTRYTGATEEKSQRLQRVEGYLRFAAFDILAYDGKLIGRNERQDDRLRWLQQVLDPSCFVHIFALETAYTEQEKREMREKAVEEGWEGLILKDTCAIYEPKRNKAWIKDKFIEEYDVVFMGVQDARAESVKKGDNYATPTRLAADGLIGAIIFGQYIPVSSITDFSKTRGEPELIAGQSCLLTELGRTSGFDDGMRMSITLEADRFARERAVFTIRAQMQYGDTNALREPRFDRWRPDKSHHECILRSSER